MVLNLILPVTSGGNQALHCVKSVLIRIFSGPYSVQMRENTDQKNSENGHFSRRVRDPNNIFPDITPLHRGVKKKVILGSSTKRSRNLLTLRTGPATGLIPAFETMISSWPYSFKA